MNKNIETQPLTVHDLPYPRRLPLLGNMHQLSPQQLHLTLEGWAEELGSLYTVKIGPMLTVVCADSDINNQILRQRPDTYRRMGNTEIVSRELGLHGVFSAEGDEWKHMRKLSMRALSSRYLKNFWPTMSCIIGRLQRRWQHAANNGTIVDVQADLMRLTVDVTTNLSFGVDINTLEKETEVIQQHLEKVLPMLALRIIIPFSYWHYFRLPADRALERSLVEIHATIRIFIEQARQTMAADPARYQQPTNFLEAMLALACEDGEEFTNDEIVGNIFTMLLAGEDTTANTMAWMLYYMAIEPDVQAKMQAEVDRVVGDGEITFKLAEKLDYIEAVINETMRLRPVAPISYLEPLRDVKLNGFTVQQGTPIMLLSRPATMDEANFAHSDQFQPERWLAPADCPFHGAHNKKAFIPFGSGPRLCPGRRLAYVEMKATMAMICQQFDLQFATDPNQVREYWGFTMAPEGLNMRLTPRQRA